MRPIDSSFCRDIDVSGLGVPPRGGPMKYHVRADCRLCGGAIEKVLDLGETPLANALVPGFLAMANDTRVQGEDSYPLYLSRCLTCGHVQLPVVVDPKLLFPADYPYKSGTGAAMREHLTEMASQLVGDLHPDGPLIDPDDVVVAEIGSNDGYLLQRFADHGVRVIGIDPAASLAERGMTLGFLTVPAFFDRDVAEAVRAACGEADIIVANNVFAHADDLHEIVEGVRILIADRGRFVFECGWLLCVLGQNNWPVCYHEHLSQHSLGPLVVFFEKHNLTLYDAQIQFTQGGSFRAFVSSEKREQTDSLRTMLAQERDGCSPERLAAWQSRADSSARAFASTLRSLKSQGKSIVGYGCSAKSTTLLHVAGIGRETIDFICDSAPTKIGKFSPGKHIPIVHPDELEKRQPDVCVSLSGNFTGAFVERHPGFRGEWISPVLDVELRGEQ